MAKALAVTTSGEIEEYVKYLETLSESELKESFLSCKIALADQIVRSAMHFMVMKKKEMDVSFIPGWLQSNFMKVATNQLLPGVMTNFHGLLFRKVSELPAQDQERLINGCPVDLVVIRDGRTETLSSDPRSLLHDQVRQVFGSGFIRSIAEQVIWIEDRNAKKLKPALVDTPYEINKKAKKLIVKSPTVFGLKDLARIIELLSE